MGSWGVKARESDHGLDSLAYIETMVLRPIDFKHFDVRAILDFLGHVRQNLTALSTLNPNSKILITNPITTSCMSWHFE